MVLCAGKTGVLAAWRSEVGTPFQAARRGAASAEPALRQTRD